MKFYVVATDRRGSEMRPGGIVLQKQIVICDTWEQAMRVSKELKHRPCFSAIQMTRALPVLNRRIYGEPVISTASVWLQGRC